MGTNPQELTTTPDDVEATRSRLSRDIDELSDKVSPGRVVQRRRQAAGHRLTSLRDRVMGTASQLSPGGGSSGGPGMGDRASGAAQHLAGTSKDAARGATDTLTRTTEGSPLAAGLVAFGAGMVISALLPPSQAESQAVGRAMGTAKEHAGPVMDEARSVAQDVGQQLKDSATDSAQQVAETGKVAAENVKEEGKASTQEVKDQAKTS